MSENDSVPGNSNGAEDKKSADAFVSDIMKREAELAAAPEPQAKQRSKIPALITVLVIFSALLAWNVVLLVHNPPIFTEEEIETDALFTLFVTSQGLEAYWDSARALPSSLEALELDDEFLRYARLNDTTYVLTMTAGTTELVYRRGEDISRFATAADVLTGETER